MSKLHVTQIEGYLTRVGKPVVDMKDYVSHSDPKQVHKAFLTRALVCAAIWHRPHLLLN